MILKHLGMSFIRLPTGVYGNKLRRNDSLGSTTMMKDSIRSESPLRSRLEDHARSAVAYTRISVDHKDLQADDRTELEVIDHR